MNKRISQISRPPYGVTIFATAGIISSIVSFALSSDLLTRVLSLLPLVIFLALLLRFSLALKIVIVMVAAGSLMTLITIGAYAFTVHKISTPESQVNKLFEQQAARQPSRRDQIIRLNRAYNTQLVAETADLNKVSLVFYERRATSLIIYILLLLYLTRPKVRQAFQ